MKKCPTLGLNLINLARSTLDPSISSSRDISPALWIVRATMFVNPIPGFKKRSIIICVYGSIHLQFGLKDI